MSSLSTLLTLSLALILFPPPLPAQSSIPQSHICHIPPCGHVENQYRGENLFAAYGCTPEETKPFEPPPSICNIWNNNKLGGPNPNRASTHCLGYAVGPTAKYTSLGGIGSGIDIDFISFRAHDYEVEWDGTGKIPRKAGEYTKIADWETAKCYSFNGKPYCRIYTQVGFALDRSSPEVGENSVKIENDDGLRSCLRHCLD